jgi:circadian clock protein KaiB
MAEKRTRSKRVRYLMRLFVSGDAPNSRIAQDNLKRLQESFPDEKFSVEIVDVNIQPEAALDCGIFITPSLQIVEPPPCYMVYGNLSDTEALLRMLRIKK